MMLTPVMVAAATRMSPIRINMNERRIAISARVLLRAHATPR
jgi:hypothetical protein